MKRLLIILTSIILIILFFYHTFDLKTIILRKMYPQKYSEYVYMYSAKYQVDPLLVFSIIKAESNFNEQATSHSNAIGLMQLMEATAIEMCDKIENETKNEFGYQTETFQDSQQETQLAKQNLYEPEINIQLGVKYISILLKKYNNNIGLALAAYNAGMGNVDEWIKNGIIKEDGSDLENIPYKETNNYVRRILNSYEIYENLYENS